MFGRDTQKDDARGLLSHDATVDDDVVWEHEQNSTRSERERAASVSEVWAQDPLADTTNNNHHPSSSSARGYPSTNPPPPLPEDQGEAASELDAEFQRIFSPVKKDQQEKARYHRDLDAACAAYSTRLEEMRDHQRERETAIELPWLAARRRREWERFTTVMRGAGVVLTCFWGGTVAHVDEMPPQVPWPPPHLARIKENHAEERKALREAHLAVVRELQVKYGFYEGDADRDGDEDGEDKQRERIDAQHVCVDRKLLGDGMGRLPLAGEDDVDEA
ncbi:hypothetical protein QBC47DRAFT_380286 [Echria macrotheca]|uniref:Uncharacterized protein n=1 Tax=Echria macrotheca TaxID=438768 RepID=A0AAJ0BE78_9PEZI|nr:hypothetical protein QBC47DRAFT_380286 [Echria macrotheca]